MDSEADVDVVQLLLDNISFRKSKEGAKDVPPLKIFERVRGFVMDVCVLLLKIKL